MLAKTGCLGTLIPRRWIRKSRNAVEVSLPGAVYDVACIESKDSACCDGQSHDTCCYFSPDQPDAWLAKLESPGYPRTFGDGEDVEILDIIDRAVDTLSPKLRELSLKIHTHPEIMFQEKYAHDLLTNFMAENGFIVTPHYLGLDTAWRAEFTHRTGGRTIGINSEMDALRGLGHACGHNLIAVSGVGAAIALKAALEARDIAGKIILLGTPAEESGGGKIILLERGAYKEMDVCVMSHPGPGLPHSASVGPTVAMQEFQVEYFGRSSHAGAAPWEGINAQDAAVLAYANVSVLRQQLKPDQRVHGVMKGGKDWAPNVIPDYALMNWAVRAPGAREVAELAHRVRNCFQAAALATSCTIKITEASPYYNLDQNTVLARHFIDVVRSRYKLHTSRTGISASTDFGNITYALPAFHPIYAITTEGGNHTAAFAIAAATEEAHDATMIVTKGLASTVVRVLTDARFYTAVKASFDASQSIAPVPL